MWALFPCEICEHVLLFIASYVVPQLLDSGGYVYLFPQNIEL